jgi:sarcosine oxidase, subunit alpha
VSERLPERQGEAIRRDRPVTFRFERRPIRAFEGDTVGSALAAAGVTITARSLMYHRPRGLHCMTGSCPNCLMQIDDVPNVRACIEPVREGMRVERQNAWPSADHDVRSWLNTFSFLTPAGFRHKVFQRPRGAWPLIEPFIRSKAGLGKVPRDADHRRRQRINLHPDVVVIGAGAAGLAAAAEAAEAGATVVALDRGREAGGHLLAAGGTVQLAGLVRRALDAGARILPDTAAFGIFGGLLVAAAGSDAIYRIRAKRLIFTTGAEEQLAVFPHNDLPGVMVSSATERLIGRYGVLPGRRAVVLTADNGGYTTAWTLKDAGAQVTVVDLRAEGGWPEGFPVIAGSTILSAHGRRKVTAVTVGPPDAKSGQKISCDLVTIAGPPAPSTSLLAQAGARLELDDVTHTFLPVEMPERTHAAGAVAGARSTEAAIAQGRLAGWEAAAALGFRSGTTDVDALRVQATPSTDPVVLPPEATAASGKQFACLCMDVTSKELETAVSEGFDSLELLKRYTALTMGPCQGKACMLSSQRLCGRATGRSLAETAPTTARPPWVPLEMGTLAGTRLTPRKETTLHDRHVAAGAKIVWDAGWRRPHRYEGPDAEVDAVRERAGLIDVSPLGSFRIEGAQAVELLERLYPCRVSDLGVGRIRYGALLTDTGAILDDGMIVRLADDAFFVTVSNEDTDAIERWITWWNADWRLDAGVLNVTGAFGAVNLAGPRARDVMAAVTDEDVSGEAMPHMSATRMAVAGVPSLVLRIGFVGEVGFEIHFPSMYGEHLWDAILEAGAPFGIAPFGLEAQRILRLEKQHILVGRDTDAGSDPFEAGLGWMVDDDKPDFLGLRALRDPKADVRERLVGFTAPNDWLPPEGSSVMHEGRRVGRVTSARRSAAAGSVIGLAWVPAGWASEGTTFEIEFGASHATGTVRMSRFYDPEGERLRS